MKALITGAAGFAGSHMAEYLLDQGEEVIALVRPGEEDLSNLASILPHLRVERADVRDAECIHRIVCDAKPDRIYHLAAMSSPSESFQEPRLTYEVNFIGTLNLLTAVRRLERDCRILHVSSAEVYGSVRSEQLPLREEAPFRPSSPYAGSKAAAELLAVQFFQSYGMPIIRARPFNHTGARQSAAFVCSNFARQIAEVEAGLRPPSITVGNLKVRRDFSDVRDIVRGYNLLLEKGNPGEVYQLGSGHSISIGEILQILIGSSSQAIQIVVDQSRIRRAEALEVWGATEKAEQAVGWKPMYPLETTLGALMAYWEVTLRARSQSVS